MSSFTKKEISSYSSNECICPLISTSSYQDTRKTSIATDNVFKGKLYQFNKAEKKSLIGDDKKCEFHVCITPSQIIQFIDDQGQDKIVSH